MLLHNVTNYAQDRYNFLKKVEREVLYAYTGTNNLVGDWVANLANGVGIASSQVVAAMKLYLDVKKANPGAAISFTGHSLGGGLASLMAVFFDKPREAS